MAAPVLLFAGSYLLTGQWVSTALTASPIIALVGVVCVLVLPRRTQGRAARENQGMTQPTAPRQGRFLTILTLDASPTATTMAAGATGSTR